MTTQWYYAQNGKQSGPVSTEQLTEKISGGSLARTDLVWSDGMASWTPAGEVPSLTPPQAVSPPTLHRPYIPPPPPGPSPALAPRPPLAPPPPGLAPPRPAQGRAFSPAAPLPSPPSSQPWDDIPLRPAAGAPGRGGEVAAEVVTILAKTKPWVRLLSVVGFLSLGLIVLASIGILVVPMESMGSSSLGPRIVASLIYLVSVLLQLPPVLFLHRYAGRISDLIGSKDQTDLENALRAQGSFWKYVGILTLVSVILGGLAFIGGLVFLGASLYAR